MEFTCEGRKADEQRNTNDIEKSKAEGKRKCWGRSCNLKRAKNILDEKVTFKQRLKGSGKPSHMDVDRRRRVFLAQRKTNAWHLRPERTWRARGPVRRPARLDQSEEGEPKASGMPSDAPGCTLAQPAPRPGEYCQQPFSWASPLSYCGPLSSDLAVGCLSLNPCLVLNSHRPCDLFWPGFPHHKIG